MEKFLNETSNSSTQTGIKRYFIVAVSTLFGIILGNIISNRQWKNEIRKKHEMSEKHLALFLMMNQWVRINQEGKHISDYFKKNGYKKIAVYGMSYVGETLVNELRDTDIIVSYGIDKNADMMYSPVDVICLDDNFESVDIIVVTAITFFEEAKRTLKSKINCPIISIEDILFDL